MHVDCQDKVLRDATHTFIGGGSGAGGRDNFLFYFFVINYLVILLLFALFTGSIFRWIHTEK